MRQARSPHDSGWLPRRAAALIVALLLCVASVKPAHAQSPARDLYIHPTLGNDAWDGSVATPSTNTGPVRSFKRAAALLTPGTTLHLAENQTFREPLLITSSGSPDAPITIEGHNAVIDLGTDATTGPWITDGDAWILDRPEPQWEKGAVWQMARLFVGRQYVWPIDPRNEKALKPGQVEQMADGRMRVLFPAGTSPSSTTAVTLNARSTISCVAMVSQSNIVIRDLTSRFAGNDGFNIHGSCQNIKLQRVTAEYNGDEGISAHEGSFVEATDSVVAFNGSQAGGIADVAGATTTYRRCLIYGNRGRPFYLTGKQHLIQECVFWGNKARLPKAPMLGVTLENVIDLDAATNAEQAPESMKPLLIKAQALRESLNMNQK
jgi:hypothetical protein